MAKRKLPKEYTDYIARVIWYLRREILHGEYGMTVRYVASLASEDHTTTTAEIHIDPVYLNFKLVLSDFVLDLWKKKSYQKIGGILAHELCHLLTQPMKMLAVADAAPSQEKGIGEVNERQTQRVANVLDSLLPAKWYEPETLKTLLRHDDDITGAEV